MQDNYKMLNFQQLIALRRFLLPLWLTENTFNNEIHFPIPSVSLHVNFWQGFFDTLRMEIAGSGISVLSVCPGKVDVPAASDRFGTTLDEVYIKQASPPPEC